MAEASVSTAAEVALAKKPAVVDVEIANASIRADMAAEAAEEAAAKKTAEEAEAKRAAEEKRAAKVARKEAAAKKAAAANMHVVLRAGGDDTIEAEEHPSPTSILASSHPPPACRDTLPAAYQGGRRKNLAQTDFPEFQDFGFLAHW